MSIHNDLDELIGFTQQHFGIDQQSARQFGMGLVKEFGGEYLYVSKRFATSQRDKEIIAAFNGRNIDELSKQYGLCARQIKNIVNG